MNSILLFCLTWILPVVFSRAFLSMEKFNFVTQKRRRLYVHLPPAFSWASICILFSFYFLFGPCVETYFLDLDSSNKCEFWNLVFFNMFKKFRKFSSFQSLLIKKHFSVQFPVLFMCNFLCIFLFF